MSMNARLIQSLADVLAHLYRGRCLDDVEGSMIRDRDCPVCMVLIAEMKAAK